MRKPTLAYVDFQTTRSRRERMSFRATIYKFIKIQTTVRCGRFAVGGLCYVIAGVSSGGSMDYTYAQLNITYSYAPELRPATPEEGGFDIPASNIKPSGEEFFAAVVAIVTNAKHKV